MDIRLSLFSCFVFCLMQGFSRNIAPPDSLELQLQSAKSNDERAQLYVHFFTVNKMDTAFVFKHLDKALNAVQKTKSRADDAELHLNIGKTYWRAVDFSRAIQEHTLSLKLYKEIGDEEGINNATYALGQDHIDAGEFQKAETLIRSTLKYYKETENYESLGRANELLGYINFAQGNIGAGVELNFEALKHYEKAGMEMGVALGYSTIGNSYEQMEDYPRALEYYRIAAEKLISFDTINTCRIYENMGMLHLKLGDYSKCLEYLNRSLQLGSKIGDKGVIGSAYLARAQYYMAMHNMEAALNDLEEADKAYLNSGLNELMFVDVYLFKSKCLLALGRTSAARQFLDSAYAMSNTLDSKWVKQSYFSVRHQLDSLEGDWQNAYIHYMLFRKYSDSLENISEARRVIAKQMQYDFDKKDAIAKAEQERKDLQQNLIRNAIAAGLAGALIFLIIVARQRNKINKERKVSDSLLLNILPEGVAEELKDSGSARARRFEDVTVMFTDFKNFTRASEQLSPEELVSEIHYCYSEFDRIITKHGLEKIKTIGDSYMCAGGLSGTSANPALDAVQAATEICSFMQAEAQKRKLKGKLYFEVRVGLHTGPVVAGIVGIKKFAYDIWGDTVNTASRMEQQSEPGRINISGTTHDRIRNAVHCTYRGKIQAKNKGEVDMYFVNQ